MRLYGLVGYPLGHSFSVRYFTEKFVAEEICDCRYVNFPLPRIEEVTRLLYDHPELQGFNVTIPHKEAIIPYLDELDAQAREIGAVNCVKVMPEGRLKGYNTDAYGFREALLLLIGNTRPAALVLGTGGASKAVRYVLDELGVDYRTVSRSGGGERLTYGDVTPAIAAARPLLINTTPLGTHPNEDEVPALPYEAVGPGHYLFDLVYNPPLTRFLREGAERGAAVQNGYAMLVAQAEKSWEIWNEKACADSFPHVDSNGES